MGNDGPSYIELLLSGHSMAEVMERYALPDISTNTLNELQPVPAFRLFMDYAETAVGVQFMRALETALRREDMRNNPPVVNDQGQKTWPIQTAGLKEAMKAEAERIIRARYEPLLPAIQQYVQQRRTDPVTIQRVTWLLDQIAAIPGALDGKYLVTSREEPEGYLFRLPLAPTIWKELNDGLLNLLDETAATNAAPAPTEDIAASGPPVARIEWRGSTIEFVTLFKRMLEKGYFDLPSTGGKTGDGNTTELLRRLQHVFVLRKETGEELTLPSLAERWRGKPMGEDRERQFDFPEATRKRPSA